MGSENHVDQNLCFLTVADAGRLLRARRLSPVELTQAYLDRIDLLDASVGAFITILRDQALLQAYAMERQIAAGYYRGPLHGIPIAVKDNFATDGVLTTCGSRILKEDMTHYDATAVARLRQAGAILLGKLSLFEFAFGDDINPLTGQGPTRNPWNLERSTSGSSSGSGAAVSASMCGAALGTDTGGSIRGPAAFCGIVGMKPTYGLVSRYGVTPLCWSLDHVGPMTRSVEDNALMLGVIAGADPADRLCSHKPVDNFTKSLRTGVKDLRIGLPKSCYFEFATSDVATAVDQAVKNLESQGASIHEIDLPHLKYAVGAETAILYSESFAYHQKYMLGGKFDEYTESNKMQWDSARYISAADYLQAQRLRRFINRDFERAFDAVDVICTPGAGTEANLIQEDVSIDQLPTRKVSAGTVTSYEIFLRMTSPANLAGVPALVMPCGFSAAGLPLSLQVMARHFQEATIYQVANAYEQATDWHMRRPEVLKA
jgi:aspartyl-tRNA(Asn)/glutamyl-tRNA(Gln) amidotransferase subunit A